MRGIRLVVLGVAVVCGIGTIAIVKDALDNNTAVQVVKEREEIVVTERIKKTEVLVATRDLKMGEAFTPETLAWQVWPQDSVGSSFITRQTRPDARDTLKKVVVRNYVVAGEPITEAKMLNLDNASVMSVILRNGMRAISVKIAPETGAGGFILPGDYVDVLLTTREINNSPDAQSREPVIMSRPVLERVRVLAIDQVFNEPEENNAAAVGRTATLEVTPEQTTVIARAEESGVVTLTLRSMSELLDDTGNVVKNQMPVTVDKKTTEKQKEQPAIIVLRNGKATKIVSQNLNN